LKGNVKFKTLVQGKAHQNWYKFQNNFTSPPPSPTFFGWRRAR